MISNTLATDRVAQTMLGNQCFTCLAIDLVKRRAENLQDAAVMVPA
jgi:hypothetical protein